MPDSAANKEKTPADTRNRTTRELIVNLSSKDGICRQQARWELVRRKESSVGPLLESLSSPDAQVRWEAAKALGAIAPPRAAGDLVATMQDDEWDVRWVAAEAVAAIGRSALPPLLDALINEPESIWLREGAHHVVHELARGETNETEADLLRALGELRPAEEVLEAAHKMKAELDRHQ